MKSFPLLLFLLLFNGLKAQNVFHWQWRLANDTVQITGKLGTEGPTVVRLNHAAIKKDFGFLYRTVDEIAYKQWETYRKAVAVLSEATVKPFENHLAQCSRIVVETDSDLLNFPVEFLQMRNQAIAALRPMVFTVAGFANKNGSDTLTLRKGFILRDPTSDPEDACTTTFQRYPGSTFRSTYRVKPDDFRFKPGVDFLLMSAHGFADSLTLRGCVFARDSPVRPLILCRTNLKLVYVDGCQQGINWSYIKTLAQADKTTFYLGPVVSNDSGESSTLTINWFFLHLKETADPVMALWQTRKQLYQHYKRRLHGMDVVNKSFVFRIYKI